MSSYLSSRVQTLKPSATLAISARAGQLRAQGEDIITLSTGEPDFPTPEPICKAAIEAINAGHTRYTPVDGIPALKQAIINKLERDNDLDYKMSEIVASVGAKQCIYNAMQAILNPGDEVIIPAPYWVSYPEMVRLAGGEPVIVAGDSTQEYKITPEQLAKAITPKTRMLILNSPSNPTGAVYSAEELTDLARELIEFPEIVVVSDDIYEHIQWSGAAFHNILNVCPELRSRTLVINGVSKAYAMTGWRIGYAAGPEAIIKAMKNIQSQSTSNPCSIAQHAAVAALEMDVKSIKAMTKEFESRHDNVVELLNGIPGFQVVAADGAFYSFPDASEAIANLDGLDDDVALCEYLLNEAGVALVPGTAFGMVGCVRLSFATSMAELNEALSRIKQAVA